MLNSLFWSFMEQGGSKFAQLLVQLVLARLLAPEVFGTLAILLVFTQLADSVAQSGMGTALIQRRDAGDREYSTAFWLSLGVSLLMYFTLYLSAPLIGGFYRMPGLVAPLRVLGLVVIFNSMNSIQRSYLQKSLNFRPLCVGNVVALFISGCLGIVAAIFGLGVWALVIQTLSQAVVTCIALLWLASWRPRIMFDAGSARSLFSYGWKICVTGLIGIFYNSISELILGKTCSTADLGLYSQGRKWPNAAVTLSSTALQNVFLPAFSALQGDGLALKASMRRFLCSGSFIIVPTTFFFAIMAEPTVSLLLGDRWLDCVGVFRWSILTGCIVLLQLVNLRAYMALGHSDMYLKLNLIKIALGVAVVSVTALAFRSITAVAFATFLLNFVFVLVIDMHPARKLHGYSRAEQLRDVAPVFVAAGVATVPCLLLSFVPISSVSELTVCGAAYLVSYLFLARLLKVESLGDMRKVMQILCRKLKKRGEWD